MRSVRPRRARAATVAVVLADVHAVGAGGHGEVGPVVDDEQRAGLGAQLAGARGARRASRRRAPLVAQLEDVDAARERGGQDVGQRPAAGARRRRGTGARRAAARAACSRAASMATHGSPRAERATTAPPTVRTCSGSCRRREPRHPPQHPTSPSSAAASSACPSRGARRRRGLRVVVLDRGALGDGASRVAAGHARAGLRGRRRRARRCSRRPAPAPRAGPPSPPSSSGGGLPRLPALRHARRRARPRRGRGARARARAARAARRCAVERLLRSAGAQARAGAGARRARSRWTSRRPRRRPARAVAALVPRRASAPASRCAPGEVSRQRPRAPADGRRLPGSRRAGHRAPGPAPPVRPVKGQVAAPARPRRARACRPRPALAHGDGGATSSRAATAATCLGATMEERGFDTAVDRAGVHELLREAPASGARARSSSCSRRPSPGCGPGRPTTRRCIGERARRRARWATGHLPQRHPARAADRRAVAGAAGRRAAARRGRRVRPGALRGGAGMILVNGEPSDVAAGTTVAELLRVARRARPRRRRRRRRRGRPARRSGTRPPLADDARVEVLTAVQGG